MICESQTTWSFLLLDDFVCEEETTNHIFASKELCYDPTLLYFPSGQESTSKRYQKIDKVERNSIIFFPSAQETTQKKSQPYKRNVVLELQSGC